MAQTKAQLLGPVVGDVVMDVSTLSLDAEGNKVGIGTTGATATLHVFEPTEGDAVVQFNSGDNFPTVNRGLVLKAATGPTGYAGSKWIFDAQSSGGRLEFQTVSTPRLTILESGNIGINRTDPDQRLNVSGNIELTAYDNANGQGGYYTAKGLIIGNLYDAGKSYTGSDDRTACIWQERGLDLDFATNNALRMKITYDGKVGIGTSNPTQTLHVEGHVLAVDGSSGLLFEEVNNGAALWLDGANGDFSGGDYYGIIANNNAQLQLGYAGDSDFVLDSAGNITIGKGGTSLHFQNGFNNSTARIQNGGGSNNSELKFLVRNAGTESEKMRLTSTAGLAVVTAGNMTANAGNETLYIQGEGHSGHGTSNTRSVVSIIGALTSNNSAAGLWVGARTNQNTAVVGTRTASGNLAIETYNGGVWGERLRIRSDGKLMTQSAGYVYTASSSGSLSLYGGNTNLGGGIVLGGGNANADIRFHAQASTTTPAERVRITSDGNVNIGNKNHLSHQSTVDSLQIGYALNLYEDSYTSGTDNYVVLGNNVHYHNGNKYMRDDEACRIMMQAGTFYFQNAATGTAGNAITFTDALRITAAGDVGIGENSPGNRLVVQKANASGDVAARIKNDTTTDGSSSTPTTASLYLTTSTGDFNTFYIQARRYDNDTHFGYSDPRSGGHTPNMIISNDGLITTPNRPRFIAKLSGNATYNPSNFGNYIDFNSEEYDIGGNFTTSGTDQGLFTAPVAGLYHFTAAAYGASVSWTQSWFVVNGGRKNYTDWVLNSTSDFVQNSQSIYLNAGDKVGFHPHRGGTSSYTIYANVHHTYFSGYLIG